ncbi:MAG: PIN domain-containing protein [Spirochaeta sp.]|nr:PIN domain-containing protein [Spirochaeta sp.]
MSPVPRVTVVVQRVVLYTNVIIAGLYSRNGASFRIIKATLNKKLEYAISPLVVLEYIDKIEREAKKNHLSINQYILYSLTKTVAYNEAL